MQSSIYQNTNPKHIYLQIQGFNKETITNINKHFVIYVDYDGNLFKTKISWANQPEHYFYDIFLINYNPLVNTMKLSLIQLDEHTLESKIIKEEMVKINVHSDIVNYQTTYFLFALGDLYYSNKKNLHARKGTAFI